MPEHLSPLAKAFWEDVAPLLDDLKVLTTADRYALELLAETYSEWRGLCDELNALGSTVYETTSQAGDRMVRAYPQSGQRSDAARRFQSALSEFGLSPASRSKVNSLTQNNEPDPWDEL